MYSSSDYEDDDDYQSDDDEDNQGVLHCSLRLSLLHGADAFLYSIVIDVPMMQELHDDDDDEAEPAAEGMLNCPLYSISYMI